MIALHTYCVGHERSDDSRRTDKDDRQHECSHPAEFVGNEADHEGSNEHAQHVGGAQHVGVDPLAAGQAVIGTKTAERKRIHFYPKLERTLYARRDLIGLTALLEGETLTDRQLLSVPGLDHAGVEDELFVCALHLLHLGQGGVQKFLVRVAISDGRACSRGPVAAVLRQNLVRGVFDEVR